MYGISFISVTYAWRTMYLISASTAYQRSTFDVTRVSTACVLRVCFERFADVASIFFFIIYDVIWSSFVANKEYKKRLNM